MSHFVWANPVRTGSDDGPTLAERTHTPDPAAVARLKALMAEQAAKRERRRQEDAAAKERAGLRARLLARARAAKEGPEEAAETEAPSPPRGRPGRRARPDEDALRALHARHLAGETIKALAAEVGLHSCTLSDYFRRRGLHGPQRKRRATDDEVAAAFAAHAAGKPWQEIADGMGISARTLRVLRRRSGEAAPAAARLHSSARQIDDDQIRVLHARYAAGETLAALEAEAQITPATLRRRFRALGLPLIVRPSGPAPFTLTAEQVAAVIADRQAGKTWRTIAAGVGCSRRTLALALDRAGYIRDELPGRPASTLSEDAAIAKAVAAHAAGQTWDAIAAELGWGRKTLVAAVRRAGHSTSGRRPRRETLLAEDDWDAIVAERKAGQTLGEIAARRGLNRSSLGRALKKRGVVMKRVVRPIIPIDEALVRRLHARHMAGEPLHALAAEIDVPYTTLARRFRWLGLARVGGARPHVFADGQIDAAVTAHAEGKSWKMVAAECGVTIPTLIKAIRRAGYDPGRPAGK